MAKKDIQEAAKKLVDLHIQHNINLTMEKAIEENPDILFSDLSNYREDENGDYPEVYEWWAITDWLADRLKEKGEITGQVLDFWVWGRQTTGQAIYMDNVIQEIAKEWA